MTSRIEPGKVVRVVRRGRSYYGKVVHSEPFYQVELNAGPTMQFLDGEIAEAFARHVCVELVDGSRHWLPSHEPVLVSHGNLRFETVAACLVEPGQVVDFQGLNSLHRVKMIHKE